MGVPCSTHGRDEKLIQNSELKSEGKRPIMRCMSRWIGPYSNWAGKYRLHSWLSIGTSGGLL